MKPIQRFHEEYDSALGDEQRADRFAGHDSGQSSRLRPLAMITFSPAVVAMRAASSLLAMPPLLRPVSRSRTKAQDRFVELRDRRNDFRTRIGRIAVVQAVDVGKQHQAAGRGSGS